jgi:hypothetical protein
MSLVEAPEAFLFGRLTGQTAVSSQIGTRIFPMLAPSGTPMPLIIYQRTAVDRPQSLMGNVGNPVITLQLTTYGTSYTSVKKHRPRRPAGRRQLDRHHGQRDDSADYPDKRGRRRGIATGRPDAAVLLGAAVV